MIYNLLGLLNMRTKLEHTAERVLPRNFMQEFESFEHTQHLRQHRINASGPVRSYEELAQVGQAASADFEQLMRLLVRRAALQSDADALLDGHPLAQDETTNFKVLSIGPLKSKARSDEKALTEYDGNYARIIDGVRCSVVLQSEEELQRFARALRDAASPVEALKQEAPTPARAARERGTPPFVVVRLKNRYTHPLFNGYRDALFNIAVQVWPAGSERACWVLCEVQLHLTALIRHKKKSHAFYEYFRSYFSGSSEAIELRMNKLGHVGFARSPDALLREALGGTDTERLESLAEVFGTGMLGDAPMLVRVERRRLELMAEDADELERATAELRLARALMSEHGHAAESIAMLEHVLAVRRRRLGALSPLSLDALMWLGPALYFEGVRVRDQAESGRPSSEADGQRLTEAAVETITALLARAAAVLREALEGQRQVLGMGSDTLSTMSWLSTCLAGIRRPFASDDDRLGVGNGAEVEALSRETLAGKWLVHGGSHWLTLAAMNRLADCLFKVVGKQEEAEGLYQDCLEARLRVLGESHPSTNASRRNLADAFAASGRWDEAMPLYEMAHEGHLHVLGEKHLQTKRSLVRLTSCKRRSGIG